MQAAFTLGWANHILEKFIMNDTLFPSKQKDAGDLLPVYMHRKGTWEDPYYFDEELPSEDDDNNNDKMKNNKIDKENKENIPDNKPLKASTSNKDAQTSSA